MTSLTAYQLITNVIVVLGNVEAAERFTTSLHEKTEDLGLHICIYYISLYYVFVCIIYHYIMYLYVLYIIILCICIYIISFEDD